MHVVVDLADHHARLVLNRRAGAVLHETVDAVIGQKRVRAGVVGGQRGFNPGHEIAHNGAILGMGAGGGIGRGVGVGFNVAGVGDDGDGAIPGETVRAINLRRGAAVAGGGPGLKLDLHARTGTLQLGRVIGGVGRQIFGHEHGLHRGFDGFLERVERDALGGGHSFTACPLA